MTVRVLALCGFTQNATIYSKQLGAVRKSCKNAEFVFLEPPHIVHKADMPWNQGSLNDFNSTATTEEEVQTPETTPRAWWFSSSDNDRKIFRNFDETLAYVHDFMVQNGPFDGVMGFSQGGCMATLLAALIEKPGVVPGWPADPSIPKFKFVISVGGFLPQPDNYALDELFPLPKSLPVLNVMGRNDVVVSNERSLTLVDGCENCRVEYHDGGHFTPSKASWRHFFNAYITQVSAGIDQNEVPAVLSFGPSGANSPNTPGSATPARPATPAGNAPITPSPLATNNTTNGQA